MPHMRQCDPIVYIHLYVSAKGQQRYASHLLNYYSLIAILTILSPYSNSSGPLCAYSWVCLCTVIVYSKYLGLYYFHYHACMFEVLL